MSSFVENSAQFYRGMPAKKSESTLTAVIGLVNYQNPKQEVWRISNLIKTRPFPYKKTFGLPAEQIFSNLQQYFKSSESERDVVSQTNPSDIRNLESIDPSIRLSSTYDSKKTTTQNLYITIIANDELYWTHNCLSEYYQEAVRIETRRLFSGKHPGICPKAYWTDSKLHRFWIEPMLSKRTPFTERNVRLAIDGAVRKQCDHFSPTIMLHLVRMFKSTSILDICAGWGDRLIASLVAEVSNYTGIDPNTKLTAGYDKIVDELGDNNSNCKVIAGCAENLESLLATEPDQRFDTVWAFPPYYNAEVYSSESTQACNAHSNPKDWCDLFLLRAVEAAWNRLSDGGHLIFNLNDIYDPVLNEVICVTEYCLLAISKFPGAQEQRCLYFKTTSDSPAQPIFVWKKSSTAVILLT